VATSTRFTLPWPATSGFLETMHEVLLVDVSVLQVAARMEFMVGIIKTKFAVGMDAKLKFIGNVFWNIVWPAVSLTTLRLIVPVMVLAVVSTVIEPLTVTVRLSKVTVLLKVVVWVVA